MLLTKALHSEGTKQLEPYNPATSPTEITKIILDNAVHRIPFAQLGCAAQYRLNIYIEDPATEKIYIGLNDASAGLYYQVRNPSGGTPIPLAAIPNSGTGYISTWAQAYAGPNIGGTNPSGYTPIVVTPTMTGDYYIEFASSSTGGSISNVDIQYFDITVAQGTTPINGRVWSKAWQIKSGGGYNVTPPTTQSFSTFYIYTDDGIVTKLNLNGSCGGTSSIYCNQYGVANTGNWVNDRKSSNGWPGSDLPQYKIFLNDPDNVTYPTGIPGQICDYDNQSFCDGTIDILLKVNKPGIVTLNIDCAPPGSGPEDRTLNGTLTGSTDCSLWETIHWDGLNGLGNPEPGGASVNMYVDYLNGLTNLPLWDVENAYQGLKVDVVRPLPSGSTKLPLYWDDSNLGGSINIINGCIYPASVTVSGCHNFPVPDPPPALHDKMVNTWWYYVTQASINLNLVVKHTPPTPPAPTGPTPVCQNQTGVTYTVPVQTSTTQYVWTLPDGSIQTTSTSSITLNFGPASTSGNLSVKGWNADCGFGAISPALFITVIPNPTPVITGTATTCEGTTLSYTSTAGITNYGWTAFGGVIQGAANTSTVSVLWNTPGADTLTLTTSSGSCPEIITKKNVTVNPTPVVSFSYTDTCAGSITHFTDNSTISSGTITTRNWNFGDGSPAGSGTNPTHTYTTGGTYTATLTVTSNLNCSSSLSKLVHISSPPTAYAGNNASICQSQSYTVNTATATNYASILWTHNGQGTLSGSTTISPMYTPGFNELGVVTLTLNAYANPPCTNATSTMTITINPSVTAYAGPSATICEGSSYTLSGSNAANYSSINWTHSGTGSFNNATILHPIYTPSAADISVGTVLLTLTAVSSTSCPNAVSSMTLTISRQAIANAGPNGIVCQNGSFTVSGSSAQYFSSFIWTHTGSGSLNNPSLLHPVYNPGTGETGTITLTFHVNAITPCANATDDMQLTIQPVATASAGSSATICEGSTYSLDGSSASDYTGLTWTKSGTGTFNDPTILHPVYTPSAADIAAGSVILTLTATAIAPCSPVSSSMTLNISRQTVINAGPPGSTCQDNPYTVSGATAQYATSYLWTAPGPGVLTGATTLTPTYTPASGQTGTIMLTLNVTSSPPCLDTFSTRALTIDPLPTANAGGDATICQGYNYTVADASALNYSNVSWTATGPGVLTNSGTLSPTYTSAPSQTGLVTLTLTAGGILSCNSDNAVDVMTINISPLPIVSVCADDVICEGSLFYASATQSDCASVLWSSGGDGTFNNPNSLAPIYTPGTNDILTGSVMLTLTGFGGGSCASETDVDQMTLTIDPMPTAYAGIDESHCVQSPIAITGATAGNNSGVQWVTSGDGAFTGNTTLTPTYMPGNIDFANGTVTLTLHSYGRLACSSQTVSDSRVMTVTPYPTVNAGLDDYICSNQTQYALHGSGNNFNAADIHWTFSGGDGTLSATNILSPIYFPGPIDLNTINRTITFTLTLQGVGTCVGQYVSDPMTLLIDPTPVSNAGPDGEVCGRRPYQLNGVAQYESTIHWITSGDGAFSNAFILNPTYTPGAADVGNIVMLSLDLSGCKSLTGDDFLLLQVHPDPSATISGTADICEGTSTPLSITFTGTPPWDVTYTNGLTPVTIAGITTSPYTFTVSPLLTSNYWITAANDAFCPVPGDSIHGPAFIIVHELPQLFTVSATNGGYYCAGDTGVVISLSGSQAGMTYELFHNGVSTGAILPGTGATLTFGLVTAPGQYAVEGTNPSGPCTAWMRDTADVIINPVPVTDFSTNSACSGDTTWFTLSGMYFNATSYWFWDFGDGTMPTFNAPVNPVAHVYPTYGSYPVTLSVTDTNGCHYTISHTVVVRPHPTAFFSYNTPNCLGGVTTFTDLSTVPSNQGYLQRWIWDYGDGTPMDTIYFPASPNVSHSYATEGTYTVILRVYNSVGCGDIWSTTVTVTRPPVADFTMAASACQDMEVSFQDLSIEDGGGAIVSWQWDFGDPASGVLNYSTQQHPTHSYAAAGNYFVTLIITNYNGCGDTLDKPITVLASPPVAFGFGAGCVGDTTLLWADTTVVNTNVIAAYAWDFGDGGTAYSRDVSHTYLAPGIYAVTLTITDTSGCENTASGYLTITTPPVAHFMAAAGNCMSEAVLFSDLSTAIDGYITTWLWDFGDGNTQTITFPNAPDVSHNYTTAGTFMVTLTVTDSYGCTHSEQKDVTVYGAPTAEFMYQGGTCIGSQVSFTDESTATGMQQVTSWHWDFGDPASGIYNTSTLENPVHTFGAAGSYTITLVAMTGNLCSDTTWHTITISPLPQVAFTTQQACRDNPVQFSPNFAVVDTNAIATWLWDFGDGNTSTLRTPAHIYNVAATYTVTLTVGDTAGCENALSMPVVILPLPVVNFTYNTPVCEGTTVSFTDLTQNLAGYVYRRTWDFGDGTSQTILFPDPPDVTHTYSLPGTFTVTLTAVTADSCMATASKTVTVLSQPQAAFTHGAGCEGMAMMFMSQGTASGGQALSGWLWDFGDPGSGTANSSTLENPTHSYAASGSYTVTLIVTTANGCSDTTNQPVTVAAPPVVDFTMAAQCSGDTTLFVSSTLVNVAATQSWLWQFGDGYTATIPDPVHIYAQAGSYTVTLLITDTAGCSNTRSYPLTILPGPVAWFSVSAPGCSSIPVTFTDLTNANGGAITIWYWNFGDGQDTTFTSPLTTLIHNYSLPGTFTASLTVTTQAGCESMFQQNITIAPSPLAAFVWQNTCETQVTLFSDNTALNGGTSLVAWQWNFGDPASGTSNTSLLQNPQHTFTAPGTYIVTLSALNASGCADTVLSNVTISMAPPVDFYHDNTTCHGVALTFHTDTLVANLAALQSFDWDFGDGSAHAHVPDPAHTYVNAGTYNVMLTVMDTAGCGNTISHSITIHGSPQAQFSYANICASSPTLFTDMSQPPAGDTLVSWQWDFGVAAATTDTSSLQNPEFTYSQPGTYTVTLTVTTEHGCMNTLAVPLQVWNLPSASFNYSTTPCSGGTVQFADSSWSYQSTITSWQWEFEPYQYGSGQHPQHTYYSVDSCYAVQLIVTDARGCIDTTQQQVCVPAPLAIAIDYQQHCFGQPAQFSPQIITPDDDSLITFHWDFGDPESGSQNTSAQHSPQHSFTQTGFYSVYLTTTDMFGCSAQSYQQVQVYALPLPSFAWQNGNCDSTVTFTSTAMDTTSLITTMIWQFGDGTSDTIYSPNTTITHHYPAPGEYTAALIVINADGCSATTEQNIQRSSCLVAAMETSDTLLCQNLALRFDDLSACDGTIAQWTWYWGDGTTQEIYTQYQPYILHSYTSSGTFTVSLVVTTMVNGTPITDSTSRQVTILPSPMAGFTAKDVCLGEKAYFNDTTLPNGALALNYRWDMGDGSAVNDTSIVKNPDYLYPWPGTFSVNQVVTNQLGCADTANSEIRVNGLPQAAFDNSMACLGHPVYFFDHSQAYQAPLSRWGWMVTGNTQLAMMNGATPTFVFDTVGEYTVMLTVADSNRCTDTIIKPVMVNPVPVSAFTVTDNYDDTQGQVLFTNGSVGALQYYWDFGNGETSMALSPMVTYDVDGNYTVQLITVNEPGCADTATTVYRMMFKGLWIPNAMAPSGPVQQTRLWKPVGVNLATYKAEVYNSHGNLLWSSTALDTNGVPMEGWDGTYKNIPCQQDVYVWKIQAVFRDGTIWHNQNTGESDNMPESEWGTVTVIR